MSVNWTARDLAAYLKKDNVKAKKIRIGDIVIFEAIPRQITKIQCTNSEYYNFYDVDGNGSGPYSKDNKVCIIARSSITKEPYE